MPSPDIQENYQYGSGAFFCKSPEYFISLCSYKNHSYVIVGVHDQETHQQYVCTSFCLLPTGLRMEKMPQKSEVGSLINLHSFQMSEEQYKQIFKYLKNKEDINKKCRNFTKYPCAFPEDWIEPNLKESDSRGRKFVWNYKKENEEVTYLNYLEETALLEINPSTKVSLNNNCRTISKGIVEKTIQTDTSLPDVSTLFFRSLPFQAHLCKGKITETLFIYPPPPKASGKEHDEKSWQVLRVIYTRLDDIAKNSNKMDLAKSHKKFNALKELYLHHYHNLTKDNPPNCNELLKDIKNWADVNSNIIDDKRKFAFSSTQTRKMFTTILKDLKNESDENSNIPQL